MSACRWGDEPVRRRSFRVAGPRALHPGALLLASDAQFRDRRRWNARFGGFDWLPRRFDPSRAIDWVEAASPGGGESALVPAACVYIGTFEAGDADAFAVADSNGCAAGATFEAAVVSGFLELVERDATALWWYGGHARPAISLDTVHGADALLAWLAARERRAHLLDLTADLGIPVSAAISTDRNGATVAIGCAAHFDANRAAIGALTEMLQIEFSLAMRQSVPAASGDAFQFWLDTVSVDTVPHLRPEPGAVPMVRPAGPQPAAGLAECLRVCRDAGLRLLTIDLTRPALGHPVARVIVPGLRSLRARYAPGRLFDVPAALRWTAKRRDVHELNAIPLAV